MSPPKVMGLDVPEGAETGETPLRRIRGSIDMLTRRMTAVEAHAGEIPALVKSVAELNALVADAKALARGALSKGILLIVSAVGGTYGVTKATQPAPTVEHTTIQKSATTVKVEACTAMQPGPERDQCAVRILTELMGPR